MYDTSRIKHIAPVRDLILAKAHAHGLRASVIKRRYRYEDQCDQTAILQRFVEIEGQTCLILHPRTRAQRVTAGVFTRVSYSMLRRVRMVIIHASISPFDTRTFVIPAEIMLDALFHDCPTRTSMVFFIPFEPSNRCTKKRILFDHYEDAWHLFT